MGIYRKNPLKHTQKLKKKKERPHAGTIKGQLIFKL